VPTEQIGAYIIEYAGQWLRFGKAWGAYLAIYDARPSNPAHRHCVFARRRVCLETVCLTQEAAEQRARELGIEKVRPARRA